MNLKLLEGKFILKLMLHFIFTVFIEKKNNLKYLKNQLYINGSNRSEVFCKIYNVLKMLILIFYEHFEYFCLLVSYIQQSNKNVRFVNIPVLL